MSGILKFYVMNPHILSTFSEKEAIEVQKFGHKVQQEIDVECMKVNDLFEKYFDSDEIDFLSVDVEGLDFEIISDIDFERFHPIIICVETSGYYMGKDEDGVKIIDFLLEKGYLVYADTFLNTIFVLKAEMQKYCKDIMTIRGT